MIKNFDEYYKLDEGKASHLPDEGDGFFNLFSKIRDAIDSELKKMYEKDYSDSEGQWSYDRAGVVIDLIKKKILIKAEYVKKALEDFNHTLESDEEKGSYSNNELFEYVEKIRDVLQKALDKHLENSELKDSFIPDDDFFEDFEKAYDKYDEEHEKARDNDKDHSEPKAEKPDDEETEDEDSEDDEDKSEEEDKDDD